MEGDGNGDRGFGVRVLFLCVSLHGIRKRLESTYWLLPATGVSLELTVLFQVLAMNGTLAMSLQLCSAEGLSPFHQHSQLEKVQCRKPTLWNSPPGVFSKNVSLLPPINRK
jgi:hypothetical protein